MKVVVDALVYETAMCIDKEITRAVQGCTLSQSERLEIILAKMQSSGCAVSQASTAAMIWLPRKRAFGRNATKHTLEPDTWEATNVDLKQWNAESYAEVLEWTYKESAARSVATVRAYFEMLIWGYFRIEPQREDGCRIFGFTEAGRRLGEAGLS